MAADLAKLPAAAAGTGLSPLRAAGNSRAAHTTLVSKSVTHQASPESRTQGIPKGGLWAPAPILVSESHLAARNALLWQTYRTHKLQTSSNHDSSALVASQIQLVERDNAHIRYSRTYIPSPLTIAFNASLPCGIASAQPQPQIHVMPMPASVQMGSGQLPIDRSFSISTSGAHDEMVERAVDRFKEQFTRRTAILLQKPADAVHTTLTIHADHGSQKVQKVGDDEALRLGRYGIRRQAQRTQSAWDSARPDLSAGWSPLRRAVSRCRAVTIHDQPRFVAGTLIDVGRHFIRHRRPQTQYRRDGGRQAERAALAPSTTAKASVSRASASPVAGRWIGRALLHAGRDPRLHCLRARPRARPHHA